MRQRRLTRYRCPSLWLSDGAASAPRSCLSLTQLSTASLRAVSRTGNGLQRHSAQSEMDSKKIDEGRGGSESRRSGWSGGVVCGLGV